MYKKRFKHNISTKQVLQPKTTNVRVSLQQGKKRVAAEGDLRAEENKKNKKQKSFEVTSIVNEYVTLRLEDNEKNCTESKIESFHVTDEDLVVVPPASTSTPTRETHVKESRVLKYPEINYNRNWSYRNTMRTSNIRDYEPNENYIDTHYRRRYASMRDQDDSNVMTSPNTHYARNILTDSRPTSLLSKHTSKNSTKEGSDNSIARLESNANVSPVRHRLDATQLRRYELIKQAYQDYLDDNIGHSFLQYHANIESSKTESSKSSEIYTSSGGKATYNESKIENANEKSE